MRKSVDDRRLDFIPQEKYDQLPEDEVELIKKHRENYRLVRLKEKRIKTLLRKLSEQKEELGYLKETLTKSNGQVDHLRKNYNFSCSFVPLTLRPSKKPKSEWKRYYNVSVGRGGNSKSISCGEVDTLKEVLLEYFKNDKFHLKSIKRDHIQWMKTECKKPTRIGEERIVYSKVQDLIYKNPIGFDDETLNYRHLFPLP